MAEHTVTFDIAEGPITVPTGTLLTEAARRAGVEIAQPCGGQGRCGRCAVQVTAGTIRRRSALRLSAEDVAAGYALACQTVVEGDVRAVVPPQEKIERRLTTDRTAAEVQVPEGYDPARVQPIRRVGLTTTPPSLDDQTDDWSRIQKALRQHARLAETHISLMQLRRLGHILRRGDWQITVVLDAEAWDCPHCPVRLIELKRGLVSEDTPLWGVAIDIGTTTVSLWLVDLLTGRVHAQVAEYNAQIARGEDVISRIIYSGKGSGGEELRDLVLGTIKGLVDEACQRVQIAPTEIMKATIAGNSTMIHLLLGIPARSIRLMPFVTAVNHVPTLTAHEVGLAIHPDATVDCLPGVASYVGADITAGVLSSGLDDTDLVTLFIDVGTNGEIVLGNKDWLVTVAASAGPAFEGGGVQHGMRATKGAIEEVWVNGATYEPTYRVIGGVKPRGLCGSGLISLLAEMFLTGVVDKGGHVNTHLPTPRVRVGEHGPEYVVCWAAESATGEDIAVTNVDLDNLIRTKAAIYAGFTVLAQSVGLTLDNVEQVLVGGSFGKYINVEKAIQIGLLPDMPWDRFQFLGNTSIKGAYLALLDRRARNRIKDIANRMTYIELSADNTFYEAFTSALFLPHTDLSRFPSVQAAVEVKSGRV
ncbi:MAG: DUF4445 domain-containing protein [Chloroflexota bacterium]|jgi:uncharacterized 2Fe-2S/4Fe-4S cluster protein (DUF4445 family)